MLNTMIVPICRRTTSFLPRAFRRFISRSGPLREYEGDGKTTMTILNNEIDSPLMIDSYTSHGFRLNNGFGVAGPMALFPKTVLGWDVANPEDITPESLILFTLLEPKLDIIVIGFGDAGSTIPLQTIKMLREKRISFEILSSEHACSTFNFLNAEKRCVAAALIPPARIRYYEDDLVSVRLKRKKTLEEMENPGLGKLD